MKALCCLLGLNLNVHALVGVKLCFAYIVYSRVEIFSGSVIEEVKVFNHLVVGVIGVAISFCVQAEQLKLGEMPGLDAAGSGLEGKYFVVTPEVMEIMLRRNSGVEMRPELSGMPENFRKAEVAALLNKPGYVWDVPGHAVDPNSEALVREVRRLTELTELQAQKISILEEQIKELGGGSK